MSNSKMNITLRVERELIEKLRKRKINLSNMFEYFSRTLIFNEKEYFDLKSGKFVYVKNIKEVKNAKNI